MADKFSVCQKKRTVNVGYAMMISRTICPGSTIVYNMSRVYNSTVFMRDFTIHSGDGLQRHQIYTIVTVCSGESEAVGIKTVVGLLLTVWV